MTRTTRVSAKTWKGLALHLFLFLTCSLLLAQRNEWKNIGPDAGAIGALAIDPSRSATVFASTEKGLFKSTDGGSTWQMSGAGLLDSFGNTQSVEALAIDLTNSSVIYAGTNSTVFKSSDGGTSWQRSSAGLPCCNPVRALAIDPVTPTTIYAAFYQPIRLGVAGVFKSLDSGGSWASTGFTTSTIALAIDPRNPSIVYCAGTQFASPAFSGTGERSLDGGSTWERMPIGSVESLSVAPQTGTVYASTFIGVFESLDEGQSWLPTGLVSSATDRLGIYSVAIDPRLSSTLYAASYGSGVFRSTDAGLSWSLFNSGLSNLFVTAIAVSASNPSVVYAGTDGGLFIAVIDAGLHARREPRTLPFRPSK